MQAIMATPSQIHRNQIAIQTTKIWHIIDWYIEGAGADSKSTFEVDLPIAEPRLRQGTDCQRRRKKGGDYASLLP